MTWANEIPKQLRFSAIALVLANLAPLGGVVLLQWSVSSVVMLYWFENVVMGVINVLRMITSSATSDASDEPKPFLVLFFVVHYFAFCAAHGVFIFIMFGDTDGFFPAGAVVNPIAALARAIQIFSTPLAFAATVLLLSHAWSFIQNYLIGGEFRRVDAHRLFGMPYGRIIVLHVYILTGGVVAQALGESLWPIVILVAIKIAVDLAMHLREHRRLRSS